MTNITIPLDNSSNGSVKGRATNLEKNKGEGLK